MDQALDHPGRPDAVLGVTGLQALAAAHPFDQIGDLGKRLALGFGSDNGLGNLVFGDPRSVAIGAENQIGRAFVACDHRVLEGLMDRSLDGRGKARAHVDSVRAE